MPKLLLINGPNLNRLGFRDPETYGSTTMAELEELCRGWAGSVGFDLEAMQSNHEGDLIDAIQQHGADGIVINPGAFTHYSYALHDALADSPLPSVEVHISNIKEREAWRANSVVSAACLSTIYGRGIKGYADGIYRLAAHLEMPATTHTFGPDPDQVGDLRVPAPNSPVMVFLHGGFWRHQWTRDLMDRLAVNVAKAGWASWNIEYRRVGTGGGWPTTAVDVGLAIDHLAVLSEDHTLDLSRVVLVGHSAGGQLALWAGSRGHRTSMSPGADPLVPATDVIGLAPISDLRGARSLSDGAVDQFLASARTHTDVYREASPIDFIPVGVNQIIVHGTADTDVPVEQSQAYARAARQAGDAVVYHEFDNVDHMTLIDPASEAWQTALDALT
ncbi:MAG: type II 3-dehydroquinate dehydratase [Acidimicrobiia bacterium]|nr:type II 3-dehydroquinate dehydratase [Acidimicrobiia bacterium]